MSEVKTILTCTSWKKRVHLLPAVLDSIAQNTVLPDKIEINLSEEEFTNKEQDLPQDLVNYNKLNISINWVGKNTKSFKKLIPTVLKYYKEDVRIITFDDDILYEKQFIEKLLKESDLYPESVISNNICLGSFQAQQCVNGRACLYKPRFFKPILWEGLNSVIVNTNEDDWWYSFVFYITGTRDIKFVPINWTLLENDGVKTYNTKETITQLYQYLNHLMHKVEDSILNNLTVLTCTYNSNEFTKHMIKSLFKQLKREVPVVIMDNGNVQPCDEWLKSNYTVIDNTNYHITGDQHQISRNHCNSIDYALKNHIHTKYVMLCDNDVLFTPNVKPFLDRMTDADAIGEVGSTDGIRVRLLPFMCVFKTDLFKEINYYDPNNCMNHIDSELTQEGFLAKDVNTGKSGTFGDTGSSVLNEIRQNNKKLEEINIKDIAIHFACGSYSKSRSMNAENWFEHYKVLWK